MPIALSKKFPKIDRFTREHRRFFQSGIDSFKEGKSEHECPFTNTLSKQLWCSGWKYAEALDQGARAGAAGVDPEKNPYLFKESDPIRAGAWFSSYLVACQIIQHAQNRYAA
jgi:ribosome modulation factor